LPLRLDDFVHDRLFRARKSRRVRVRRTGRNPRLVWWFRGSLHCLGESIKRTSEPEPHWNHRVASVPLIPKFVSRVAARTCEFRNRDPGAVCGYHWNVNRTTGNFQRADDDHQRFRCAGQPSSAPPPVCRLRPGGTGRTQTKKAGKKPAFFVVPRDVRIRCDQYRATAGPPQR
jgi:hypothetical protein